MKLLMYVCVAMLSSNVYAVATATPTPTLYERAIVGMGSTMMAVTVTARPALDKRIIESTYGMKKATVVRIKDGDTFVVTIQVWPAFTHETTVRLMGIDTPEIHSNDPEKAKKGNLAMEFTKSVIVGKTLFVVPVKIDSFGRTLAFAFYELKGSLICLNDELVERGLAIRGWDKSRN